jgi:hypothetical protein
MIGMQTAVLKIIEQLGYRGFVLDWAVRKTAFVQRFRRVFPLTSVNAIDPLRTVIEGCEVLISDRPGRREPIRELQLREILFAESRHDGAEELGCTADEIVCCWFGQSPV